MSDIRVPAFREGHGIGDPSDGRPSVVADYAERPTGSGNGVVDREHADILREDGQVRVRSSVCEWRGYGM